MCVRNVIPQYMNHILALIKAYLKVNDLSVKTYTIVHLG